MDGISNSNNMSEKNSKYNRGITIASLGGLATIFGMTSDNESAWTLPLLVAGVVLALIGVYMTKDGKGEKEKEEEG